jgi:hypothetical protein
MGIDWQFWARERTIDDVKVFLRKIDWDDLRELFDIAREQYTRRMQSGHYLRKSMRMNLLKAREFLSRMSHNAHTLQLWAKTELRHPSNNGHFSPERRAQFRATAQMAADFRSLSRMQRIKLGWWIILRAEQWPAGQMPSIASLRNLGTQGELDLVLLYQELKTNAAKLALPYGQQVQDDILAGF